MDKTIVFIDTDNVPYSVADEVLESLSQTCRIDSIVAAGLFLGQCMERWQFVLSRHINTDFLETPRQLKNATDLVIAFRIGLLAQTNQFDNFAIVSKDNDFATLCDELTKINKRCIRIIPPAHNKARRSKIRNEYKNQKKTIPNETIKHLDGHTYSTMLKQRVYNAMGQCRPQFNNWYRLADLGQIIANEKETIKITRLRHRLINMPEFEVLGTNIRLTK